MDVDYVDIAMCISDKNKQASKCLILIINLLVAEIFPVPSSLNKFEGLLGKN